MEFFQEPTLTVFFAVISTFILAKIVSFAVSSSNSTTDDNPVVCSTNEGSVAKEVNLNRGLRVKSAKNKKKKVKFVDDVMRRRVDLYEGSENLELLGDIKSVEEKIVEGKIVDKKEKIREIADRIGENEETCFDISQDKGSEKVEEEIDGDDKSGAFSENQKSSGTSEQKFEIPDEGENDDDDWEGIERSELEKVFAEAVNYLEYGRKVKDKVDDDKLARLGSDVQMELYGLHKVAVEGPCHEPQPMALKVSARAKWNAWQRLGSMSQDAAMEQYIRVLSDNSPDWMHAYYSADNDIQGSTKLESVSKISNPDVERKSEIGYSPVGDYSEAVQCVVEKVNAELVWIIVWHSWPEFTGKCNNLVFVGIVVEDLIRLLQDETV
ncbi:acyl-coa-binding domain-containing protein 3 [Phtheirospermum japonicum]|uniref:Acyl-coa-binding domain-containing protein 3 n=1 Tax=Phtheirospermum japonicum TaxID=374723 RepID=A0A830B897_9LAMI|nr:acyl-coa-binding domain-containing protein 3 [Phtheirospermum japonicum]